MNFLKKSLVKQESCKKKQKMHIPGIRPGFIWAGGVLVVLALIFAVVWYLLPVYNAKFYLTRSALQTQRKLSALWGPDKGEGDAYEDYLKLVADEIKWNDKSVLILPGGLGISWTEQRNKENSFVQGSLDVYFLGAIREGAHYWADDDQVVFRLPGIADSPTETTQETLKSVMGFSLIPEKKSQAKENMNTIRSHTISMLGSSRFEFTGRDEEGVKIKAEVPADLFDSYLTEMGGYLSEGPGNDLKQWADLLTDRKTSGGIQEIIIDIDKKMDITGIHVEGLGDISLGFENNAGVSIGGNISLEDREFYVDSKIYFGNSVEGKRAFQIPELNITYNKNDFHLKLELSGGYEGGKVSEDTLDLAKLKEADESSADEGIKKIQAAFLEKIQLLGFDLNK